jgi:hypothetical protein
MRRPRLPLRWSHRFARMLVPRTWQGRAIQMVLALGVIAYACYLWPPA